MMNKVRCAICNKEVNEEDVVFYKDIYLSGNIYPICKKHNRDEIWYFIGKEWQSFEDRKRLKEEIEYWIGYGVYLLILLAGFIEGIIFCKYI